MSRTTISKNTNRLFAALVSSTALASLNPIAVHAKDLILTNGAEVTITNTQTFDTVRVGTTGSGTLTIKSGGVLNSDSGTIGESAPGTVLVTGPGSLWKSPRMKVFTNGTLTIADGATVDASGSSSGGGGGGQEIFVTEGTVLVTGTGSTLIDEFAFIMNSLTVADGAVVNFTNYSVIDSAPFSALNSSVTVTGAGSTLNASGIFIIGERGPGTGALVVENGGVVSSDLARIGQYSEDTNPPSGGTGTVLVTGAGSTWTNSRELEVGVSGTGTLTIADGGVVEVGSGAGTVDVALNAGSTGTLNIGAAAGDAAVAAGILDAAALAFGAGTGTLNFNHTDTDHDFAVEVSGAGTINHVAGVTALSGNSSGFTGTTNVTGGTLLVNNLLGGDVNVTTGTLGGSGTISGDVSVTTGAIAAGNGPGTLTIGGDLALAAGSSLNFELGNPSGTAGVDSDLINVGGNLTLDGTLNVSDAGGFGQGLYRLVNYGGTLTDNGLDIGFAPSGFDNTNVKVQTATAGQVNLLVGASVGSSPFRFWDGGDTTGNGKIDGGAGTWTAAAANWTVDDGNFNGAFDPSALLIFAGTPGTVTVDDSAGAITIQNGMQFAADGYSVIGDAIGLTGATVIRVGDGTSAGAGFTTSIASSLTGTGSLNKTDLGTLVLTGDNSGFTGTTTVTGGTLLVNNVLGGDVNVTGGKLGGIGTISGDVSVSGIIAPGNSIGTLHVDNVSFNTGSTFEVEVDPAGQADKIVASGTATINGGTVQVLAGKGNYALATQYTILTAADGRTGTFAGVTSNLAFLDPSLSYDATNVYLTMSRNDIAFENVGLTPNQIATGGGVESLGFGDPIHDAVLNLSAQQARDAFDQLSGEIHTSAKTVMIEDSRFLRAAVNDRLRGAFDSVGASNGKVATYVDGKPVAAAADTDDLAVWGQGFGSWGNWNTDGNAATIDRSVGGFVYGADVSVFDTWRIGAVAGYSQTSFQANARSSSGSSDNYHMGLYGGAAWGDLTFRSGATYTWSDVTAQRSANFSGFSDDLKGDYDAGTAQVFGELGYGMSMGALRLEPFANLAYVNAHTEDFAEDGGDAVLTSQGATSDATFTTLGLRSSMTFDLDGAIVTARSTLGWRHAFGDMTPDSIMQFASGGDPFSIAGVPIARDAAVVELGLDLALSPTVTLGVTYVGQFGSGATDQSMRASFNVKY